MICFSLFVFYLFFCRNGRFHVLGMRIFLQLIRNLIVLNAVCLINWWKSLNLIVPLVLKGIGYQVFERYFDSFFFFCIVSIMLQPFNFCVQLISNWILTFFLVRVLGKGTVFGQLIELVCNGYRQSSRHWNLVLLVDLVFIGILRFGFLTITIEELLVDFCWSCALPVSCMIYSKEFSWCFF